MNIDRLFAPAAASPQAAGKKELGQDDFLKLLVAQLKNQDPSSPSDNSEFLSQIAQFSMVSGIDDLGTSFNGIAGSFYTTQAMQAADLVGRQVLAESDRVVLAEGMEPTEGLVHVPEYTDMLTLQVRDSKGALVKTLDAGDYSSGTAAFSWDHTDADDKPLPAGSYTVVASALVQGAQVAVPVSLYHSVESISVARDNSTVELQLANDQQIPFSQISQYR